MDSRLLVDLRNDWGVQTLVLFSFVLQVFLLMFAWIRRHKVSTVPRFLLWLAYQLADSTALFTLGHMAISRRPHDEQPLMAFWAPFLLVHLGGQDTITAYSFEDNRLWLRHLQTLVVQVLAASYVLYKYMPDSESHLRMAAALIFAVGILKYGERIWALRSASFDNIWDSLDDELEASVRETRNDRLLGDVLKGRYSLFKVHEGDETVLMGAHGLLDVCMGLFVGLKRGRREWLREIMRSFKEHDRLDKLMEMELSLMYDILYTKATVIHTWYGRCIRVVALVATAAALLLFQFSGKDGHSRKDKVITYVLAAGALLLELSSLVRAVGSTWTCAYLYHRRCKLYEEILVIRQSVGATRHRRWSGIVGQYNLLQSCANDAAAGWLTAIVLRTMRRLGGGVERTACKWWDKLHHSSSAELSDSTRELILKVILDMGKRGAEIGSMPGLLTLEGFTLMDSIGWSVQDIGFEESIMAWHLATDICLFDDRIKKQENLAEAIRVLSNYMMFLLVLRPYMLPGPVRQSRYTQFHDDLLDFMTSAPADHVVASSKSSPQDPRVQWALDKGFHAQINSDVPHAYFNTGLRLADVLYDQPNRLDVILGVWVEMLCYVANHCSRESHARQLSMGGELVTVVWLMAMHANLSFIV